MGLQCQRPAPTKLICQSAKREICPPQLRKKNRPNKQRKVGNNITFADLHHECKTSTTSTGTSDGMKTTNHCLKFDSFLLLSSQPDLVALGKENGCEFMRGELE